MQTKIPFTIRIDGALLERVQEAAWRNRRVVGAEIAVLLEAGAWAAHGPLPMASENSPIGGYIGL